MSKYTTFFGGKKNKYILLKKQNITIYIKNKNGSIIHTKRELLKQVLIRIYQRENSSIA